MNKNAFCVDESRWIPRKCPFCGYTDTQMKWKGEYWVLCKACEACGPLGADQLAAMDAWNKREET